VCVYEVHVMSHELKADYKLKLRSFSAFMKLNNKLSLDKQETRTSVLFTQLNSKWTQSPLRCIHG